MTKLGLKVTVEYTIENCIDKEDFKRDFNNNSDKLLIYLGDSPNSMASDFKILKVESYEHD